MIMKNIQPIAAFISVVILLFTMACNNTKPGEVFTSESIKHNGLTRDYVFYSPDNQAVNLPLMVVLHGFKSSAEEIMDYSGMNKLAKENNFAVVYPQGTVDADSNAFWNVGYAFHEDSQVNDVDYLLKLIAKLQKEYKLSETNTFLTGMSNGGDMSYLMACRYPELFNGAATVSSTMLKSFFVNNKPYGAIPMFVISGTNDSIYQYNGDVKNEGGWGKYASVPFIINYWANKNKTDNIRIDTLPDVNKEDGSFVIKQRFWNNESRDDVLLYRVVGGGHDWPGASGNMDVDLSQDIWTFFSKYVQD